MEVLIKMIDPGGIERTRPSNKAINCVSFFKQEFGEIGPVLTGDTADERFFGARHINIKSSISLRCLYIINRRSIQRPISRNKQAHYKPKNRRKL